MLIGIMSVVIVLLPRNKKNGEYSGKRISITSFDGKKMVGYLKESEKVENKWVILVHSYRSDHTYMNPYAEMYLREGYHVIQPDNRAHGQSEGYYIGMGYLDQYDILMWIHYITAIDPNAEIVLHGVSMGASAIMMLSGNDNVPENVVAIIADCGYKSARDYLTWKLNYRLHLPSFPIIPIMNISFKLAAGYYLNDASAINQVSHSRIPIFFIHGSDDTTVPVKDANDLYSAAGCRKDIYIVHGAGHGEAFIFDSDLYREKVFEFIKSAR